MSSLQHLERRLALIFGAVMLAIVACAGLGGAYVSGRRSRTNSLALADSLAETLTASSVSLRRAGKYHLQQFYQRRVETSEAVVYIAFIDTETGVFSAHSNRGSIGEPVDSSTARIVQNLLDGGNPHQMSRQGEITQISHIGRWGFDGKRRAVVQVGVRGIDSQTAFLRALTDLTPLLVLLTVLGAWLVQRLARRVSRPVVRMANRMEGLMAHAPLLISVEDAEGRLQLVSGAFESFFGVRGARGQPASAFYPLQQLRTADTGRTIEVEIEGTRRTLLASRFPVGDEAECVVAADITDLERARADRAKLAAAIDQADDMLLITDLAGVITYANPSVARNTGRDSEGLIGASLDVLAISADLSFRSALAALSCGTSYRGQVLIRRADGHSFPADLALSPIERGSLADGFVVVVRDQTELASLQAQLRQSQKMDAVGRLAGGIAHDFNNLLTVINGLSELLVEGEDLDPESRSFAEEIQGAGVRAAELTGKLLAISRRQVLDPQSQNLGEIASGVTRLLVRLLGERIEIETDLPKDLWLVRVDRAQVEQVLINLAVNARDAMNGDGTLTIRGSNRRLPRLVDTQHVEGAECVELVVEDTGCGMSEQTIERIFEPFFTTKGVGKGTGLGLSTVHGIVVQSGGWLRVESVEGQGTRFYLSFPRALGSADLTPPEAPGGVTPGGGELILVIEDEAAVRRTMSAILTGAGYEVVLAEGGEAAVELMAVQGLRPDLVLSDLVMPRMTGPEVIAQLHGIHGDLRYLFISGYSADALDLSIIPRGAEIVQKPPTAVMLTSAVVRALSARPAGPIRSAAAAVG